MQEFLSVRKFNTVFHNFRLWYDITTLAALLNCRRRKKTQYYNCLDSQASKPGGRKLSSQIQASYANHNQCQTENLDQVECFSKEQKSHRSDQYGAYRTPHSVSY